MAGIHHVQQQVRLLATEQLRAIGRQHPEPGGTGVDAAGERALRRRFPQARVRLVVSYRSKQVLPLIPFIDESLVFETALRQGETVPAEATTVVISLDGVLAPMRDGERAAKQVQSEGKRPMGPAGYREVGCATLSFYNAAGQKITGGNVGDAPFAAYVQSSVPARAGT